MVGMLHCIPTFAFRRGERGAGEITLPRSSSRTPYRLSIRLHHGYSMDYVLLCHARMMCEWNLLIRQ